MNRYDPSSGVTKTMKPTILPNSPLQADRYDDVKGSGD